MSLVVSIVLAALCLWLVVLTIVSAAVVRQTALMSLQLQQRMVGVDVANDGLAIGSFVPSDVLAHVSEARESVAYVLLTSPICAPCRDLVPGLSRLRRLPRVVALVPGEAEVANSLASMFPEWIRIIRDPAATALASAMRVSSTPFAFEIDRGQVTGKAFLHEPEDLATLATSSGRERTDSGQLVGKGFADADAG